MVGMDVLSRLINKVMEGNLMSGYKIRGVGFVSSVLC